LRVSYNLRFVGRVSSIIISLSRFLDLLFCRTDYIAGIGSGEKGNSSVAISIRYIRQQRYSKYYEYLSSESYGSGQDLEYFLITELDSIIVGLLLKQLYRESINIIVGKQVVIVIKHKAPYTKENYLVI
jgi:hypothetical protein